MNQQAIVQDIEARASAARLPIGRLCRMAGITHDTFINWRKGRTGANLHSIEKIYQVLDDIDQQDAKRLAQRGKAAA